MELLKDWSHLEKSFKKKLTPRQRGTNPRAKGTNPRAKDMSKRKSKAITVGKSNRACPHCAGEMIIRKHGEITDKLRKQYYYFTQWDYCVRCKEVFFDEKNKKLNPQGVQLQEVLRQRDFLASI